MKVINIFRIIFYTLATLFLIWFGISYIEVLFQNTDCTSPTVLSNWNVFEVMSKFFECQLFASFQTNKFFLKKKVSTLPSFLVS